MALRHAVLRYAEVADCEARSLCHPFAVRQFLGQRCAALRFADLHFEHLLLAEQHYAVPHYGGHQLSVLDARRLAAIRSSLLHFSVQHSLVLLYVLMLRLLLRASVRLSWRSFLKASCRRIALPFVV